MNKRNLEKIHYRGYNNSVAISKWFEHFDRKGDGKFEWPISQKQSYLKKRLYRRLL